jgi:hypothetical protein
MAISIFRSQTRSMFLPTVGIRARSLRDGSALTAPAGKKKRKPEWLHPHLLTREHRDGRNAPQRFRRPCLLCVPPGMSVQFILTTRASHRRALLFSVCVPRRRGGRRRAPTGRCTNVGRIAIGVGRMARLRPSSALTPRRRVVDCCPCSPACSWVACGRSATRPGC